MSTTTKVSQAAAMLAGNPSVEKAVEREISRNVLVSKLLSLRVAKGMTQEDVAKGMGCDPSKVSRIESGNDLSIKWADVMLYLSAMNLGISIVLEDPTLPAADRIKEYVYRIHADLEKLTTLATEVGGNDEISKKIHQFNGEVLMNFLTRYKDNYDKLCTVLNLNANKPHPLTDSGKAELKDEAEKATECLVS